MTLPEKSHIGELFNRIAPSYDFLNHLLSLGIDRQWRRKALRQLPITGESDILDVACGTGDFTFEAARRGAKSITGIDLSTEMLKIAEQKRAKRYANYPIRFQTGDSATLPFQHHTFDAVTVAFGVRNFAQLQPSLHEIFRVMKPNATLLILEFSLPTNRFIAALYLFYFNHLLPLIGGIISKNRAAYRYLPQSVKNFPQGDLFLNILSEIGFQSTQKTPLTFGIAQIYRAIKPDFKEKNNPK